MTYRINKEENICYLINDFNIVAAFAIVPFQYKYQLIIEMWAEKMEPRTWRDFLYTTTEISEDRFHAHLSNYITEHEAALNIALPDMQSIINNLKKS